MRNFKKVLSLCLVLVMLCSVMSISAFATDQYTVTIYLERIIRDEDNEVTSHSHMNGGATLQLVVDSGTNLKTVIATLCDQTGSAITDDVWGTNDGEYLTSLKVNGVTYANNDHFYPNTPTTGKTTYIGDSWMYFEGTPSSIPETTYIYPSISLYNRTVTADTTITLSYETQTFVW